MNLLMEAMNGLGAVLLPAVMTLLFEELTFGGLARLLMAQVPGPERHLEPTQPNTNQKGAGK
jgi:hypothetical protein